MKCPECDTEQPDDTAVCKGCGLNFSMWVAHTGESLKPSPRTSKEPAEEHREEKTTSKAEATNRDPGLENAGSLKEPAPEDESGSGEKPPSPPADPDLVMPKRMNWVPVLSIGLGLVAVLALAAFYFTHHTPSGPSNPGIANATPTAFNTPGLPSTPGLPTLATSPLAAENPVKSPVINTPTPKPTSTPTPSPTAEEPTATFTATSIPPAEALAASESTPGPGTATEAPTPETTLVAAAPSTVPSFPSSTPNPKDLLETSQGLTLSLPTAVSSPKP